MEDPFVVQRNEPTLGCGLIRLGRAWGARLQEPLRPDEAQAFLSGAVELGVTFFDTAPAYGESERILGDFLRTLSDEQRDRLVVATKVGEHWVPEQQTTVVNHEPTWARQSIEQSLTRLGRIDILQIHKATAELLRSDALAQLLSVMQEYQIPRFGVSISDMEAFSVAQAMEHFTYYQFPYNSQHLALAPALSILGDPAGGLPVINRPLAMGDLVKSGLADAQRREAVLNAFAFVLSSLRYGIVLTGTASLGHLKENIELFMEARRSIEAEDGATTRPRSTR